MLILAAEWFVAERGQKLKRISRVFLYSGLWYVVYWLSLVVVPAQLSEKLVKNIGGDFDPTKLVDAVLKAVAGLFSSYFLGFAIICLVIALILYIIRHLKHGDVMSSSNTDTSAPKAKSKR